MCSNFSWFCSGWTGSKTDPSKNKENWSQKNEANLKIIIPLTTEADAESERVPVPAAGSCKSVLIKRRTVARTC